LTQIYKKEYPQAVEPAQVSSAYRSWIFALKFSTESLEDTPTFFLSQFSSIPSILSIAQAAKGPSKSPIGTRHLFFELSVDPGIIMPTAQDRLAGPSVALAVGLALLEPGFGLSAEQDIVACVHKFKELLEFLGRRLFLAHGSAPRRRIVSQLVYHGKGHESIAKGTLIVAHGSRRC